MAIDVEDDGVGMGAAMLGRLFEEREEEKGYCVRNIDCRLRLMKYGESFGLSYRSQSGRGTTATVRIPAPPTSAGPGPGRPCPRSSP